MTEVQVISASLKQFIGIVMNQFHDIFAFSSAALQVNDSIIPDYLTIEGMRGQEYSVGIFIFMLVGVAVFMAVIFKFMLRAKREKNLKTGELVMFICIILGTVGAVVMGAMQLLQGQLF